MFAAHSPQPVSRRFTLVLSVFALVSMSLSAEASEELSGSPWAALKDLQDGNKRFCGNKLTHNHQDKTRRDSLSQSQHPQAIVISCSDSRVPAEIVFDQGLGDIFSVRLAGHVLNAEAIASVEYAVEHLGSRLIIVMGHESCGAVKAAVNTPEGTTAGSENLDQLLSSIRKNIVGHYPKDKADKILLEPVEANVSSVTKDLVNRSKIIQKAVAGEKLVVVQAVYSLASGKARFIDVGQTSLKQLALGKGSPQATSEAAAREPASAKESSHEAPQAKHVEAHEHAH